MYRYINYGKLFEDTVNDPTMAQPDQTAQPAAQTSTGAIDPKKISLVVTLSEQDIAELEDATGKVFTRPGIFVDKNTMDITAPVNIPGFGNSTMVALAIAMSDDVANFPVTSDLDPSKNLIFNVYPKQIALEGIEAGPVALILNSTAGTPITVSFVKAASEEAAPTQTEAPTEAEPIEPTDSAQVDQDLINFAETGEPVGSNPSAIKSFDDFIVGESKKQWIKELDIKKGALRKSMKKGKEEKISAADIAKSEAKLKKKDKDKKKPGLQLNPKDAKKHKQNTLAKNLMKASGAISESRQAQIKGTKEALVKLHEVIEKMIKQTSAKNKGI